MRKGLVAAVVVLLVIILLALAYFGGLFSVMVQGDEIRLGETGSHSYARLIIDAEHSLDNITISGDVLTGSIAIFSPFDKHYSDDDYWEDEGYDADWSSATSFCRDVLNDYGAANCYGREDTATCAWYKYHRACYDTGYDPCGSRTSVMCLRYDQYDTQNFNISIEGRSIWYRQGSFSGSFETQDFSEIVNELCADEFKHFSQTGETSVCELDIVADADFPTGIADSPKIKNIKVNYASGAMCVPEWDCGEWSDCSNEQMTKECTDLKCGYGLETFTESCTEPVEDEIIEEEIIEEPIEEETGCDGECEIEVEGLDGVDYYAPVESPDSVGDYWYMYKTQISIGLAVLLSLLIVVIIGVIYSKK